MVTGHNKACTSFVYHHIEKHFVMKNIYIRTVGLITIFGSIFYGFTANRGDQVSEDLRHADPGIHWPTGFSPKTADLYAHNEIMIDAPVGVVFRHIQEAEKWPEWYANSQHVVIQGSDKLLQKDTEWTGILLVFISKVILTSSSSIAGWAGLAMVRVCVLTTRGGSDQRGGTEPLSSWKSVYMAQERKTFGKKIPLSCTVGTNFGTPP
jgi:hypothetical protein